MSRACRGAVVEADSVAAAAVASMAAGAAAGLFGEEDIAVATGLGVVGSLLIDGYPKAYGEQVGARFHRSE